MCRRGNPARVAASGGVPGSYGMLFSWGAPGVSGTVVIGVLRRVPGSPGTKGWPRCCCRAVRMRRAARRCHSQFSPLISSGL